MPKFKSRTLESAHFLATAFHEIGAIDKKTMREIDELALVAPPGLTPAEIKQIREENKLSQPVFARYLNISESIVQKWEQGDKKPSGAARKLLSVVQKHGLQVLS